MDRVCGECAVERTTLGFRVVRASQVRAMYTDPTLALLLVRRGSGKTGGSDSSAAVWTLG